LLDLVSKIFNRKKVLNYIRTLLVKWDGYIKSTVLLKGKISFIVFPPLGSVKIISSYPK